MCNNSYLTFSQVETNYKFLGDPPTEITATVPTSTYTALYALAEPLMTESHSTPEALGRAAALCTLGVQDPEARDAASPRRHSQGGQPGRAQHTGPWLLTPHADPHLLPARPWVQKESLLCRWTLQSRERGKRSTGQSLARKQQLHRSWHLRILT